MLPSYLPRLLKLIELDYFVPTLEQELPSSTAWSLARPDLCYINRNMQTKTCHSAQGPSTWRGGSGSDCACEVGESSCLYLEDLEKDNHIPKTIKPQYVWFYLAGGAEGGLLDFWCFYFLFFIFFQRLIRIKVYRFLGVLFLLSQTNSIQYLDQSHNKVPRYTIVQDSRKSKKGHNRLIMLLGARPHEASFMITTDIVNQGQNDAEK